MGLLDGFLTIGVSMYVRAWVTMASAPYLLMKAYMEDKHDE